MSEKKRVYCLYRVSTKGQVEKDDIPMQKEYCRDFAAGQGWEITKEFSEKGVSGFKVSAKDRDAIREIQQAAALKKFDILLVFMFDRLGRREDETPFVVEWFVRNGIEVWSAKEGQQRFDTHVDKLTNYIRYWQASGESIKTSIRTKTRLAQIVQEGRYRGGTPPYGYRLEKQGRINHKNHEVYEIVIDDGEAAVVRQIFRKYVQEGFGAQRISRYLLEQGIMNRKGINFANTTIIKMLKNPTYLGILRSGESQSEIFKKLQIIDEDTFQRAQEIMKQRTMKHSDVPLNSKGNALLAGKVFCGHCGSKLVLTTSGKNYYRADGTFIKKIRLRYQCHYKVRHPQLCDGQSGYGVTTLDGIVEKAIHQLFDRIKTIPEDDMIQSQIQKQEADYKAQLTRAKVLCNRREKELSDYQSEVLKVIRGESKLSTTIINELIEKAEGTLQEAQKDEAHWAEELDSIQQKATDMHKLYGKVVSWSELFDTCNMAEKKMIVSQLIRQVRVWKDYRIKIDFNVNIEQLLTYQQPPLSA
jgi:DNA invertase Pin-like site-specific DNA recombinase